MMKLSCTSVALDIAVVIQELVRLAKYLGLLALCVAILQISIGTSQARCGETLDQCVARYGQPIQELPDPSGVGEIMKIFKSGDFKIVTIFLKGVVKVQSYGKEDGSAMSYEEEWTVMRAEAQGDTWEIYHGSKFDHAWIKKDGMLAILSKNKLIFITKDYLTLSEAKNSLFHF